MEEVVLTRELLDQHFNPGANIIYPPGRVPKRKSYNVQCQGCIQFITLGERVWAFRLGVQWLYLHPSMECVDKLKKRNLKLYKYSGLRKKFEIDDTSGVKDSGIDERDRHLYDKPTKW